VASSLALQNGVLVYRTPYSPQLVTALKGAVPPAERRWDPSTKAWLVVPKHLDTLKRITAQYLGEQVHCQLPLGHQAPALETRAVEVRYIGATKERGSDERTAYGWSCDEWSVVFPESVLRSWFCAEQRPDERPTLYAVLGVKRTATDSEVKEAFRRLARQWHPDVCREPDAAEQFMALKQAYDFLSDPVKRAKYDAGLALQQHAEQYMAERRADTERFIAGYRPPLRCGLVLCEGTEQLGRFVVSNILAWADIQDAEGRVLSTSWPAGADTFIENWV